LPGPTEQGRSVTSFSVNSYGYGPYMSYGSGMSGGVATPWATQYGAWITPAASYWASDDIARQQAYTQRFFQSQDYEFRRLALRRAAFDQMMYERANTPPPETLREEARLERLSRARNTPPLVEVASGEALNELLNNVQRIAAREQVPGYAIAIDPETLRHINVTTSEDSRGSNELFKPNMLREWPAALADPRLEADKELVRSAISALSAAQESGKADELGAVAARRALDRLRDNLFQLRFEVASTDYIKALAYLSKLDNVVAVLDKSGAANYLNGTFAARGRTMAELTDYMIGKGLKFAKATPGDEPYYSTLYQQLSTYELAMSRNASKLSTTERTAYKNR
jgi:hypothetical protein